MKVPRQQATPRRRMVAAQSAGLADEAEAWEPSGEPRGFRDAGGTCSDCHSPVRTEPRGTVLWCSGCGSVVVPAAVLAPYERGTEVTRVAKSQRERDLEALDLAARKGAMLAQLGALAEDERRDPASLPKVEWFADEVRSARTAARLDDLAGLFTEAGIRARRWWQRRPALPAAYDEDDEDQADEDDGPPRLYAVPAIEAGAVGDRPGRMSWDAAIAACGWQVDTTADGCQVVDSGIRCTMPGVRQLGRIRACAYHQGSLGRTIDHYQRQQEATA